MPFVIDSSVVLAVLRNEEGSRLAAELALGATMSSVNLAEIVTKCVEFEIDPNDALQYIAGRNINVVEFGFTDGVLAGRLWKAAPKGKLSLGDRACIATAIKLNATIITADRIWAELDLPCKVELIR
ncbi:MAG: type II toxin-antitoxin system VapC family toxin [Hyphomicrobiales bacterium]|nr:type II toxin-antitoxin system VapC family toxin [Hyphomicrobiales bacterium]